MVFVVNADKNGKITLTKDELQGMLDKAYEEGRSVGYRWYPTYYTTTTLNNELVTCDSTEPKVVLS